MRVDSRCYGDKLKQRNRKKQKLFNDNSTTKPAVRLAPLGARAKFVGTCLLQDAAEIASAVSVILVHISVSAMLLLIDVLGTLARVARSSCCKKSNRLFVVFV
jgi:hypothetical protein